MNTELNIDTITFGKYKNKTVYELIKDRKYCKWLLEQDWFKENYEYIFNKVNSYKPLSFFLNNDIENENFIESYKYFNLISETDLKLDLTDKEKICYRFYLRSINDLKDKIIDRIINCEENSFNVKAPTKWLKNFENETGLSRDDFKDFIYSYELPNITSIVEDIKNEGGLEYKGSKSFLIAKKNSELQENYWGEILKKKYGDIIGIQFKYEKCIFDFINIPINTIYECKIGLKDFNESQYEKYILTLNKYKIIYLISNDCIINMEEKKIYTTNITKYLLYQCNIPLLAKSSKFDDIILEYKVCKIENISEYI